MSHPAGQELHSTNKPIYGAATTKINNTMFIYGGFYNVAPWNKEAMWTLSDSLTNLTQLKTDPYSSPAVIHTSMHPTENNTLTVFGGHQTEDTSSAQSLENETLRYYRFNFSNMTWTPLQKRNATTPLERFWHTTTMAPDGSEIFLYGGKNITSAFADFWKYTPSMDAWTALNGTVPRCGHSSSMTSDGKMIILGGYDCSISTDKPKKMYDMDKATIFNIHTQQWHEQTIAGPIIPPSRAYHTSVTTKQDFIIICGGQDGKPQPFQNYISGGINETKSSMTAILDTRNWSWIVPEGSPFQPFPRSHAIASIVNDTKMVFGFGLNYHTVYDGLYVFDIESYKWLPPTEEPTTIHTYSGQLVIILSVIGGILGLSLLCALIVWMIRIQRTSFSSFRKSITRRVWNPRAGEPLWAEVARLLFRLSFLAVFIIIATVLSLQVKNSPVVDQKYYIRKPDSTIDVPDIRFCFDGWVNQQSPVLQCATDFGESCSEYIVNITDNVYSNLNYYGTKLNCYLFRANTSTNAFKLGRTDDRLASNGSFMKFYYYGNPSNNSIVHIVFYPHQHNPNIPVYNIAGDFDGWYSSDEDAQFQSTEQENLRTENAFDVGPTSVSRASYELKIRERLLQSVWNYIGFSTKTYVMHEVASQINTELSSTHFSTEPQPLGSLQVFPIDYQTTVLREQRAFTLVNGMGIIGGIFGLIVGFQSSLFGYRPRSPWGIVHRWSVGLLRRSLLDGLKSRFPEGVNIPIIHPVHHRFSEGLLKGRETVVKDDVDSDFTARYSQDDDIQRMARLEERLHVFELLFQAYYINDEVFRSLGSAIYPSNTTNSHYKEKM
ncbi:galactose oxidase [Backusella circina FSU 941]|nr:galactose oxidase [Backusella circina FSU 941]